MTARRPVFSVDGGGVISDVVLLRERLGESSAVLPVRLRVHVTDDPAEDLTVYVEDGRLHVVGQYRPVWSRRTGANHVELGPGDLPATARSNAHPELSGLGDCAHRVPMADHCAACDAGR